MRLAFDLDNTLIRGKYAFALEMPRRRFWARLLAASSFLGGLGGVQNAAYQIQQAVGGTAHDKALETAVAEGKQNFKQCTRCGHWVCPGVG